MTRRTMPGVLLIFLVALAVGLLARSGGSRRHPSRHPCHFTGRMYVDARHGSDENCGTGPGDAWRTIARVGRARTPPGSVVLLAGGETAVWGDGASSLVLRSNTTVTSYGSGRAVLRAARDASGADASAIFLCSVSHVTVENLDLEGGSDRSDTATAIASGEDPRRCGPSVDVEIRDVVIRNWFEGVQAGYADRSWRIERTTIDHTAGDGILFDRHDGHPSVGGDALSVLHSAIRDTGEHPPSGYAVHGIYDNSSNSRLIGNTIERFSADGVSIRFHGATVEGNVIAHGSLGIGAFSEDSVGATTHLVDNTISDTADGGIFVCGPSAGCPRSRERFVVMGNTFRRVNGLVLNLAPTAGGYRFDRHTAELGHHPGGRRGR